MLDFPSQMDGRPALLCWKLGEVTIAHWHGLDDSPEERKPLDTRFGKGERDRPN